MPSLKCSDVTSLDCETVITEGSDFEVKARMDEHIRDVHAEDMAKIEAEKLLTIGSKMDELLEKPEEKDE